MGSSHPTTGQQRSDRVWLVWTGCLSMVIDIGGGSFPRHGEGYRKRAPPGIGGEPHQAISCTPQSERSDHERSFSLTRRAKRCKPAVHQTGASPIVGKLFHKFSECVNNAASHAVIVESRCEGLITLFGFQTLRRYATVLPTAVRVALTAMTHGADAGTNGADSARRLVQESKIGTSNLTLALDFGRILEPSGLAVARYSAPLLQFRD